MSVLAEHQLADWKQVPNERGLAESAMVPPPLGMLCSCQREDHHGARRWTWKSIKHTQDGAKVGSQFECRKHRVYSCIKIY